jgi:hypothetical protein
VARLVPPKRAVNRDQARAAIRRIVSERRC